MISEATNDLLEAAEYKDTTPGRIKSLIKAGADVSAKNRLGKIALDYAETDKIRRIILDAAN